jgi:DNA phosphorothioation-associated putative methyltransferase
MNKAGLETIQSVNFAEIVACCDRAPIGKRLLGAFYIHISALPRLDKTLQEYEQLARSSLTQTITPTLIKFVTTHPKLSYLFYPDFLTHAHPDLHLSIQVDLTTGQVNHRDYRNAENAPVLHRKETFLAPDHPHYAQFAHLTRQQDALGLLNDSREIGTRIGWQRRLQSRRIELHDHTLACSLQTPTAIPPTIDRHKAAIVRTSLSKPVRLALESGLFTPETTFFDYGCGYGGDRQRITEQGYVSAGWDPHYCPDQPCVAADIVNLGYIINVIEDPAERREALIKAWMLTQQVLVVAAQVLIEDRVRGTVIYGDGVITRRNTFQKNYEQEELKSYIDQVLQVDAMPIALGIYFVFRDETQAQSFRASRYRSRTTTPRVKASIRRFEEYQNLLTPLMVFVSDRGRLPLADEVQNFPTLQQEFGTLRRAFQVVLQATNVQEWDAIADQRRQDLLVYLALSHFSHRPKLRDLAAVTQNDIKGLFGSYQQACTAADLMLMGLGNLEVIEERCRASAIGQKRPNSLWIHVSAIDQLDPLLRLYEGCASRTIGRPPEANIIKFHFRKPKITYLSCPDFDPEPHPPLETSMQIDLRDLHVHYRDYDLADSPPLLHQKNLLVAPDYPQYEKFAKLTRQEEDWGLLDDVAAIFDRQGWLRRLAEYCAELKGHRVVWRKDADPERVKKVQQLRRRR